MSRSFSLLLVLAAAGHWTSGTIAADDPAPSLPIPRNRIITDTRGGNAAVIRFSADGKTIAGLSGKQITLWDVRETKQLR